MSAKLFVVATPIGNLEDMTPRAIRILQETDFVAAEDTQHTGHLLHHFQLHKPLISYHQFSEAKRTAEFLQQFGAGKAIDLVSDTGERLILGEGLRPQIALIFLPAPRIIFT